MAAMLSFVTSVFSATILILMILRELVSGLDHPLNRWLGHWLNSISVPLAILFFAVVALRLLISNG